MWMSDRSRYSEWTVAGPLATPTTGIGSSSRRCSTLAPSVLRVRLPRFAEVTACRNGVMIAETRAAGLDLDITDSGVYRVEARIDERLWLVSNPVLLRLLAFLDKGDADKPRFKESYPTGPPVRPPRSQRRWTGLDTSQRRSSILASTR